MKDAGSVAILILNYNSKPFLTDCLTSIAAQNYRNFTVFLIDNHSTDGSVELVREKFPETKIIQNPDNYGFGKGFNQGIKKVYRDFDYIALLNPDVRLDKNWLEESIITFKNRPRAMISSGLVLDWYGGVIESAGGMIVNFPMGIFGGMLGDTYLKDLPEPYRTAEHKVFCAIANVILVRSNAFIDFGLFDESYFMYFEDIDFSWRVLLNGKEIWFNPKAVIYHYGHGAKKTEFIQLKIASVTETNLLATYFKNLSSLMLILTLPVLLFVRFFLSFIYCFTSPKVTPIKLKGIGIFLLNVIVGKYAEQRRAVQKLRKLNDFEVLSLNPGSLFSFTAPMKSLFPWSGWVRKVHSQAKK